MNFSSTYWSVCLLNIDDDTQVYQYRCNNIYLSYDSLISYEKQADSQHRLSLDQLSATQCLPSYPPMVPQMNPRGVN